MDPLALREFLYVLSLEYRGSKTARILAALPPVAPSPAAAAVAEGANDPMAATNTLPTTCLQGAAPAAQGAEMPPASNAAPRGSYAFVSMVVDDRTSSSVATPDANSAGRGEAEFRFSTELEMSPAGRGEAEEADEREPVAMTAKEGVGDGMVVDYLNARWQGRAPTS